MASPYGDIPSTTQGPIILLAQLDAAPGHADVIQQLLSDIQRFSLSDQEPGCLVYRTSRSFVADSSGVFRFVVFEQYRDAAAIAAHFATDPFKALVAKIGEGALTGPPKIEYFSEFKA